MQLADLLPPETVDRVPMPDEPPPVHGAQWDEVHGCWERWSERDGQWHVVGPLVDVPRPPGELADVIDVRDSVVERQG